MRVSNCMIGRYYPFFLTNGSGGSGNQYYLYAIESPSLSSNFLPYISLKKMGEKTKQGSGFPNGNGNDLLSILVKKDPQEFRYLLDRRVSGLVKDILRPFDVKVERRGKNFPIIEYKGNQGVQKALITCLRSMIRQRYYKVLPGRYIDVMWTKTEYVVFKIVGNSKEGISLEPCGVYKNIDIDRSNPLLSVNLKNLNYPKEKFTLGQDGKISGDLDSVLRKIETSSFNQPSFVD